MADNIFRALADRYKPKAKTMNAKEYRACLEQLGMTNRGAAAFFGVGERTARDWLKRDHIDRPIAMVLRTMIAKNIGPEEMLTIAEVRKPHIKFILKLLHDRRTDAEQ